MPTLDAAAVARLLVEIGQRLVLAGENPYKARAYVRAAEALATLTLPLEEVVAQGRLRDIPGVGAALADTIRRLHRDGTTPKLEAMRQEVPASALDMLRIPGLGPDKVHRLIRELGVTTVGELEAAARQDRLKNAKGFGAALQAKVLAGMDVLQRGSGQRLLHHAAELLAAAEANLRRSHPGLDRITAAGDFRRACELVADLAIVAQDPATKGIQRTDLEGGIRLWRSGGRQFGAALLMATGSAGHIRQLQEIAARRGYRLDEAGLEGADGPIACEREEDVYAALGLAFIPPELREAMGEVELAAAGGLPVLVTAEDIRGLLHCHTDFSDGGDTLEAMAEATRARGYSYFGVADHSRSAGYAGGLSVERVALQHVLVEALNARYRGRFRIFKGIESDILEDGSLDYPDDILTRFDFVVASVHSRFRLDPAAQTARVIRAVSHPRTTILGHMTGRMLLRREGYALDIEPVLQACAAHGVAVEINANPHRLDLDWRWHRRALELGCMLSINPDAHSTSELDLTRWGVAMARKGGVPKERVLNCLGASELAAFFRRRARSR